MNTTKRLSILLFPDVELLDFCGPFEVFSVAARQTDPPAFDVFTVAESLEPITARNGLSVNPQYNFGNCPAADLLLVPGGGGTRREMDNPVLIDWIVQTAKAAELVMSVCTGALLLGKAGLLDGLEATTHRVALELLREVASEATVLEDRRYVDNGKIVTSAGIATGIDMSLHVVGRLLGSNVADATGRHMEYGWPAS